MRWLRSGISWAGFAVGATAWAISTQLNYALVGSGQVPGSVPWIALLLVIIALSGGALSWRAWHSPRESLTTQLSGEPQQFLAGVGVLASTLFAGAIALQGIAALIVR